MRARIWLALAALALAAGCGATGHYEDRAPMRRGAPAAPVEAEPEDAAVAAGYGMDDGPGTAERNRTDFKGPRLAIAPGASLLGEDDHAATAATPQAPGSSSSGASTAAAVKPPEPERKVVYRGFLRLQVKRLLDAVERIARAAEDAGGYVDSLGERVVIVRVPGEDFEAAMATFQAMGEVLERRVEALDVTAQFFDMRTRLEVARSAERRLLALLEKVTETKERLRIIRELKRLGEKIELLESRLATLRNLIEYFTITIELVPLVEAEGGETHRSPFRWVRRLRAHYATLFADRGDVSLELPRGFVLFDQEEGFRAQAADSTTIRCGAARNEPYGDAGFWAHAVRHELTGRGERVVAEGEKAGLRWAVYSDEALEPRCWLVGVEPSGEEVYVVEVFFPTEEAYAAHKDAVIASLATLTTE